MTCGKEPGSNGMALDDHGNLLICEHEHCHLAALPLAEKMVSVSSLTTIRARVIIVPTTWYSVLTVPCISPVCLSACFSKPTTRATPVGALHCRAPDGKVTREITELSRLNDLTFSPGSRTIYISNADSLRPVILAYEVKSNGRLWVKAARFQHE